MKISSDIIAGQPTINGNIYSHTVLRKVIDSFNTRALARPSLGGEFNSADVLELNPAYTTKYMFIDESGAVCADIEFFDTEAGKALSSKISNSSHVVARPIICRSAQGQKSDPALVDVYSIVRVQVECNDKPK